MTRLAVKDWFHTKKMNEMHKNVQTTDVFAIIKESEKAMQVLVGTPNSFMVYWAPKSCLVEVEAEDAQGKIHKEALTGLTYEEAVEAFKATMSQYK